MRKSREGPGGVVDLPGLFRVGSFQNNANGGNIDMTDLVKIPQGSTKQVSLADLQDRLDARKQISETRSPTSTRKGRVEEAKRVFTVNPMETVAKIEELSSRLADVFSDKITMDSVPLTQDQINKLSQEFVYLERLKVQIEALETRYRDLVYSHLDKTGPKVSGRPASQVPGKVSAEGPGEHYEFERRGGNRANPLLDTAGLRGELTEELASQVFVVRRHKAVEAWEEELFDEARFLELVESGDIDLDLVAKHLKPGSWRTPSFYKTLVDGVGHDG